MDTSAYTTQEYKYSHFAGDSTTNTQNIFELFAKNTKIFTKARPNSKAGSEKGWLNNLLTPVEAQDLTQRTNYNIGIALGRETGQGDYTVCFDRESGGSLPEDSQNLLESNAVAVWESPHGGRNYLLTVSENALNELEKYKEKVYITGDEHDLEILKSKHALIPPSSINHNSCSENKPCNGSGGWDSYNLGKTGIKQTIDFQTVRRIVAPLPVEESQETTHNTDTRGSNGNEEVSLPELSDDFEPTTYFKNKIPGDNEETYLERLNTMLENDAVAQLWYGNYEDRSKGELELRSYAAWYFNADTKMVQHIFENELPNWREEPLKYELNQSHAKDVITDIDDYINRPYYTTGISFNLWGQLSREILKNETTTVNELHGKLYRVDEIKEYEKDTIHNALKIFEKKDIINRISNTEYENKRIDQEYVKRVNELNKEYSPTKYVDYE